MHAKHLSDRIEVNAGLLIITGIRYGSVSETRARTAHLLVGVGVGERPLSACGGVVPARALGPGVLQGAATAVPGAGRAPPAAVILASSEPASASASASLPQQQVCHLAVVTDVAVALQCRLDVWRS